MKPFLISLAFLLSLTQCLYGSPQTVRAPYVPSELLIKLEAKRSKITEERIRGNGAKILERFDELGWRRVKIPKGRSVEEAIKEYSAVQGVLAVQPNFYYHLLADPNDPLIGSLYGMAKISAPAAWDMTTGSSSVVVADIDTGMRYTHEDLAANAWTNSGEIPNNGIDDDGNGFVDDYYGYDFFYNDPDPFDDAGGHGTHTAGTIGAVGNDLLGVVGVNWNVKIMPIKIYSPLGTDSTSAMLVNAYNYVTMMKNRGVNIRVTNNSYGDCGEACGYDQATKDALDAMGNAGILNVFAAGNNGRNIDTAPFFPASYTSPSILAVAASDQNDNRAGFSNYGAESVDIAAPGVSILSTVNSTNSSYGSKSGTSMATPHVAGAAALLSAYNPSLSPASLKATLMNTADVLPNWAGVVRSGGRLNIAAAIQNQTVCTFDTTKTSVSVRTKGGYYSIDITAPKNCDFEVKSNSSWIKLAGPTVGSGTTAISFRVGVNPTISRSGSIQVAGHTVAITQSRNGIL
jgi:subtilisin family serine protease